MDLSRDTALDGAESKDPEGAYLTHAVRSFSTTEAREQDLAPVRPGAKIGHPSRVEVTHQPSADVASCHSAQLGGRCSRARERPAPSKC
jgi:hypothetical protein